MRIFGISDLHGHLPDSSNWPSVDVAVIAGDVIPANTQLHGDMLRQWRWIHDRFVPWIMALPATHAVITWGNHDWIGDSAGPARGNLVTGKEAWWPANIHLLVNRAVIIDGVKFYGVPQTPRFYDWAFNEDDNEDSLGLRWASVPDDTDVLVSHGPPYGAVDWVGVRSDMRVGSVTMRRWLEVDAPRPAHVFCGHIHSAGGHVGHVHNTRIYNVAMVDEGYRLTGRVPDVVEVFPRG